MCDEFIIYHIYRNLFVNLKAEPAVTLKRQVSGIFVQDWIQIQIDLGSLHLPTLSAATPRLMRHSRKIMITQIQEDHLPVIPDILMSIFVRSNRDLKFRLFLFIINPFIEKSL